jgi:glycosyltransferase involved in cell wall biosynthesis
VVSRADAGALEILSRDAQVDVVPNGVDTVYWQPDGVSEPDRIVFTGTMNFPPNVDAMVYFVSKVMPRVWRSIPGATLYIVGQHPAGKVRRLASERVIVTGRVEDVRPYVAGASVYVAPIRFGSGTHLKVLEALAMAKPLVATSRGAQALELTSGRDCLIADEPAEMAEGIVRLLTKPETARALGEAGRVHVVQHHDWSIYAGMMHELLASVMTANVS